MYKFSCGYLFSLLLSEGLDVELLEYVSMCLTFYKKLPLSSKVGIPSHKQCRKVRCSVFLLTLGIVSLLNFSHCN